MPSYDSTLRSNRMDEITSRIGSNGLIRIYSGTPPTDVGTGLAGNTLLAELALSATAAPSASGGVLTFSAISDDGAANATGTATFARITQSDGTAVVQLTVGDGSEEIVFNTAEIVEDAVVSITSLVATEGNE